MNQNTAQPQTPITCKFNITLPSLRESLNTQRQTTHAHIHFWTNGKHPRSQSSHHMRLPSFYHAIVHDNDSVNEMLQDLLIDGASRFWRSSGSTSVKASLCSANRSFTSRPRHVPPGPTALTTAESCKQEYATSMGQCNRHHQSTHGCKGINQRLPNCLLETNYKVKSANPTQTTETRTK